MITRRKLLGLFTAAVANTAMPAAGAQPDIASSPEDVLMPHMRQVFGVDTFVLLDKPTARLKYIDQGRVVMDVPTLLGRQKGDDEQTTPLATPSGIFANSMLMRDDKEYKKLGGTVFAFNCKPDMSFCYSVHSLYQGNPKENRYSRLVSPTVEDNFISHGCPNVFADDFKRLKSHLNQYQAKFGQMPYVVITPQNQSDLAAFIQKNFAGNNGLGRQDKLSSNY